MSRVDPRDADHTDTDPVASGSSSTLERTHLYRAHLVPPHADGSDVSSLSSSAPSVPSYQTLRQTHLVTGLICSPLVLLGFAFCAAWAGPAHRIYWLEVGLGVTGLFAIETLRRPLIGLTPPFSAADLRPRSLLALLPLVGASYVQAAVSLFIVSVSATLDDGESFDAATASDGPSSVFRRAIWLGMGSATADIGLRTAELLRQVTVYRDVLELEDGAVALERQDARRSVGGSHDEPDGSGEAEAEAVLEAHLRARERLAIIDAYGVPLDRIPGFLLVTWQVNSVLLSVALYLLLYLGYLSPTPANALDPPASVTWLAVGALRSILSVLWVVLLPVSGLAPVSFSSFVVLFLLNLVIFAMWGVVR